MADVSSEIDALTRSLVRVFEVNGGTYSPAERQRECRSILMAAFGIGAAFGGDVEKHLNRLDAAAPQSTVIYGGTINVGDHFIWMKDMPRAWAHIVVTKIDEVDSKGGKFDERRIWTRVIHGTVNRIGSEAWNEEGRCREAFTPCDERGTVRE